MIGYVKNGIILFNQRVLPSKRNVLKKAGVRRNTFAGDMISRLYDLYFLNATRFYDEYNKYYRNEFGSLELFVEEHFNIDLKQEKIFCVKDYSYKNIRRCSMERNIEILTYDKSFSNLFSNLVGGINIENPDWLCYE